MMEMPNRHDFINPVLEVLRSKGGAAPLREISNRVIDSMGITDLADIPHAGDSSRSEIYYRVSWAIQTLQYGNLVKKTGGDGGGSAHWELTPEGFRNNVKEPYDLYREYRRETRKSRVHTVADISGPTDQSPGGQTGDANDDEYPPIDDDWKEELLQEMRGLSPSGFEKLCQHILDRLGFEQVEVTGKSHDGGIDGTAIIRQMSVLSSRVYFQCKRYNANNPVTVDMIRSFIGAILTGHGQGTRGLYITTGRFTKEAEQLAINSSNIPIDTIDGGQLAERMRSLELGGTEVSVFRINRNFFQQFS